MQRYAFFLATLFFSSYSGAFEFKVKNTQELKDAIIQASFVDKSIPVSIVLQKGLYKNATNLNLSRPNMTIRSETLQAFDVVLSGSGMKKKQSTEVIFYVNASNVKIEAITMRSVANHLIQIRAEEDADYFYLKNSILLDSYEQLVKVSTDNGSNYSDYGRITGNYFGYSKGIGPHHYIGGIDAHHARNWKVDNNHFYGISSPGQRVSQHAIHFWNNSMNILVINNVIINSDRGIGFGLTHKDSVNNGLIRNNLIFQSGRPYSFEDVGISLENASRTLVRNNSVYLSNYPTAIEKSHCGVSDVMIRNNLLNRPVMIENCTNVFVHSDQIKVGMLSRMKSWLKYFKRQFRNLLHELDCD